VSYYSCCDANNPNPPASGCGKPAELTSIDCSNIVRGAWQGLSLPTSLLNLRLVFVTKLHEVTKSISQKVRAMSREVNEFSSLWDTIGGFIEF
jgi:hypothetical protein